MGYHKNNREILLPGVDDTKAEELKHSKNVRSMTYSEWFYCHPSAYMIFYLGLPIITCAISSIIVGTLYMLNKAPTSQILLGIWALLWFGISISHVRKHKQLKSVTFYELYFK